VTITATNTFQQALAANPIRLSARIQNNGIYAMYLVLDPNATFTPGNGIVTDTTTAIVIAQYTIFDLASQSGEVCGDQVWLTGTANEVVVCIEH
jgi:hypothetical protein